MSLHDVMPSLRRLSRRDKLCVIQFLAQDLAANELDGDQPSGGWSFHDQFEAATTLAGLLESEKDKP